PMERMTAWSASNASMSRNWRVEGPGGDTFCQVAPPSTVRSTVPRLPLVQATFALIAETPRKLALVPVGVRCQEYVRPAPEPRAVAAPTAASKTRTGERRFSMPPHVLPGPTACKRAGCLG